MNRRSVFQGDSKVDINLVKSKVFPHFIHENKSINTLQIKF